MRTTLIFQQIVYIGFHGTFANECIKSIKICGRVQQHGLLLVIRTALLGKILQEYVSGMFAIDVRY